MTPELKEALEKARSLPDVLQDEIAWIIYDKIASQSVDLKKLPPDYRMRIRASLDDLQRSGQDMTRDIPALYAQLT